ncbi:MAG: CoA-binding protein [Croceimicrobium sp.]
MKTLVVGASPKPERYSNKALLMLHAHGFETEALGLRAVPYQQGMIEKGRPEYQNIDTISLYLGPRHQAEYFDYLISLAPRRVIFNPGTENPEFYKRLDEAGIAYELACTLVLLSTGQY